LTSPKADLSSEKEQRFNHAALVPQFTPRIPCYKADSNERFSTIVQRNAPFLQWVGHLQSAYFGQKSILSWTLAEDDSSPPRYPNSYRNPLAQISLTVPSAPVNDPERGPKSARHKAWSAEGQGPTRFEWVSLEASLQWRAFQRLIKELRARGNSVFVIVGPFNEHMVAEDNQPTYLKLRDGIRAWLEQNKIPNALPATLPSELYADASHPLTEGYQMLAEQLHKDPGFRTWLGAGRTQVASTILADVEPGFQPGGSSVETAERPVISGGIAMRKFFPGGWKPPSTAGRDACRYIEATSAKHL
jgi:hypothetical protein